MCIDYRALNKLTVKNRYPLPRIDRLLDALAGSQYISFLDAQSGFWQLRLNHGQVDPITQQPTDNDQLTAFRTPWGLGG
jgi:hypothetical protein